MLFGRIPLLLLVLLLILCSWASAAGATGENLLANGGFEDGLKGWNKLWSRAPSAGQAALDRTVRHSGDQAVRIEHTGKEDWSLAHERRFDVRPGEIYELSAWVRLEGPGEATASVVLYDAKQQTTHWSFGGRSTRASATWRLLRSRFVIPRGAASMWPRVIGHGPAKVWFDDVQLVRIGSVEELRAPNLPKTLTLANPTVKVAFDTQDAALSVVDMRTGQVWRQHPCAGLCVLEAKEDSSAASAPQVKTAGHSQDAKAGVQPRAGCGMAIRLLDSANMLQIQVTLRLDSARPELVLEMSASGELVAPVEFPGPFRSEKGMLLIMPVNEGISYPVDDSTLGPMWYHLYGGHGLCMGWWGITDGRRGLMAIIETPDDAAVRVARLGTLLCQAPQWLPQRGQFGPARRLRYVLFDDGGYVAMCKRYRQYAQQVGLLKTLAQKRDDNPNVDKLIGAVNVWCWDQDGPTMCREMQALGIRRILWSNRQTPEQIRALNALGVLTSRYDIYQDLMDPAVVPKLRGLHSDWTQEGWPRDLTLGPDGQWLHGWRVKGKDGQWYPCGILCDSRALEYARRRVLPELKTHPYQCRFIDTTTAAPWYECYHPDHPMTRSDSKRFKMELLKFISQECRLVTGSETGHEAAVPYVHYFEGMLSLGPYRVPDAGRAMLEPVFDVPERVAKFQTGHYYRLPLWELVYHDCVVAQWYWGDYNNKLPALWDRRDLWNALYGTPPMFMFNRAIWKAHRDRFVQSYRTATPIARATGYCEMLSHRWLTEDHAVQQTRFANGVVVTANFGQQAFTLPDGSTLAPLSYRAENLERAEAD